MHVALHDSSGMTLLRIILFRLRKALSTRALATWTTNTSKLNSSNLTDKTIDKQTQTDFTINDRAASISLLFYFCVSANVESA